VRDKARKHRIIIRFYQIFFGLFSVERCKQINQE
jgi:hypothetical protein